MSDSASGCAVGADGTLLDASQIQWFNDTNDSLPLPPTSSLPNISSVDKISSDAKIHPFFKMKAAPVTRTAGARHSAHAPHPSARMRDPDNAESSILAGQKRWASLYEFLDRLLILRKVRSILLMLVWFLCFNGRVLTNLFFWPMPARKYLTFAIKAMQII